MKADRVNRWLTLGANIGVVIGIILLIVELDQNRQMMRAQIRNDISAQLSNRLGAMGSNSEIASLKHRAETGQEISADEEYQYFLLFIATLRDWENIHYQYRHGMFDDDEFEGERAAWRYLVNSNKAFAKVWCPTRRNYSSEFVIELEKLYSEELCTPYISGNGLN